MIKRDQELAPTLPDDNPGVLYIQGLYALVEQGDLTIAEATEQTVQKLREEGSEEHIEPTLKALKWIQSHPEQLSE